MPKQLKQEVAGLPAGYSSREAKWEDLEAFVELSNLDAQNVLGAEDTSLEEIRIDWEDPDFNLAQDSQLVFSEGEMMVGLAEIFKFQTPPVRPIFGCAFFQEKKIRAWEIS